MRVVLLLVLIIIVYCQQDCIQKCWPKENQYTEECLKHVLEGKKVMRCSIKKINRVCDWKCSKGKRCFNICQKNTKVCEKVPGKICQKRCFLGEKCHKHCSWKKLKCCYFDRVTDLKCKQIMNRSTFSNCIQKCYLKRKCWKTCFGPECTMKNITCSIKKFKKDCNQKCATTQCFNVCKYDWHTKNRKCRQKCLKGYPCKKLCTWNNLKSCYNNRMSKCFDRFNKGKNQLCLFTCFKKKYY